MANNLFDGKQIRALTIVYNFSRECMAIHIDHGIRGDHVAGVINTIGLLNNRCLVHIQVDNESDFFQRIG